MCSERERPVGNDNIRYKCLQKLRFHENDEREQRYSSLAHQTGKYFTSERWKVGISKLPVLVARRDKIFHRASTVLSRRKYCIGKEEKSEQQQQQPRSRRAGTAQRGAPVFYHARADSIFPRRAVSRWVSPRNWGRQFQMAYFVLGLSFCHLSRCHTYI